MTRVTDSVCVRWYISHFLFCYHHFLMVYFVKKAKCSCLECELQHRDFILSKNISNKARGDFMSYPFVLWCPGRCIIYNPRWLFDIFFRTVFYYTMKPVYTAYFQSVTKIPGLIHYNFSLILSKSFISTYYPFRGFYKKKRSYEIIKEIKGIINFQLNLETQLN